MIDGLRPCTCLCGTSTHLASALAQVIQLHDEVLFEVLEAHAHDAAEVIRRTMELMAGSSDPAMASLPPMPTTVVCGRAWGTMTRLAPPPPPPSTRA